MNEARDTLVAARAISKTYSIGRRSLTVLRELSFQVARGEFIALRGASGAGKSTLLHLLGGLDSPDGGDIVFDGQNLATLSSAELAHVRNFKIGFVFQSYHLLPELDALENVSLPARIARSPARVAEERGRELLSRVGLQERMEHRPAELSGGERQRVAIARALINQPDLILADEPTGNLDSHSAQEVLGVLQALRKDAGKTIILVTHDPKAAAFGTRQIHLEKGELS